VPGDDPVTGSRAGSAGADKGADNPADADLELSKSAFHLAIGPERMPGCTGELDRGRCMLKVC